MSTDAAARVAPRRVTANPQRLKALSAKIIFAFGVVLVWHAVVASGLVKSYIFPGPVEVAQRFGELAHDGTLLRYIWMSMQRMLIGYSISVVGGVVIGVLCARSWFFKETVGSLILSLQSLPSVCWLPIALLVVGIGEQAVLAVVILGALFSIAVATEGAIRNIPPIYLKVGRVMGARGFVFARDVLLFASLPELVGGLKLGWTFAWRSLMAAELIRQDILGVGRMLEIGRQFNDAAMMIAGIVTILAIGLFADVVVFGTLERRVRSRWGLEAGAKL
jgi:NitT/TauT family transport system permease protein